MMTKFLAISISFFILVFVVDLIRREKMTFKYAVSWIVVSLMAFLLSIFDSVLGSLSAFFGFALASNFIFFILLAIFVFMSLLMSIFLCQQNKRNDMMAQKIGSLEFKIEQMEKNSNHRGSKDI